MAENIGVQNDDQLLLASREVVGKNDMSSKYLFFDDGTTKIDCMIAYEVLAEDDDAES